MSKYKSGQTLPEKLERLAVEQIPSKVNLWPDIARQLNSAQISFSHQSKRPVLRLSSVLIALAALLVFSAAAYGLSPLLTRLTEQEAGTKHVFQKGLGKELNLVKNSGVYPIKLEKAYADANRIILALSVEGLVDNKDIFFKLDEIQDEQGNKFSPTFGMGNSEKDSAASLLYFDTANLIKGSPAELKLHANVTPYIYKPAGNPTAKLETLELEPVEFVFGLPYYAGKSVEVNKTVTDKGVAVTLEKLVITPSGTRVYLKAQRPETNGAKVTNWFPAVEMKFADGASYRGGSSQQNPDLVASNSPEISWNLLFVSPMFEKYGEGTLQVSELIGFLESIPPASKNCLPPPNEGCARPEVPAAPTQLRIKGDWSFKFNYTK